MIVGALIILAAVVVNGIIVITKELKETRKIIMDTKITENIRNSKTNTAILLVDGRYNTILQELADIRKLLVEKVGDKC